MYAVISLLIVIIIFMSISKGITASIWLSQLPLYYTPSALICKEYVVFVDQLVLIGFVELVGAVPISERR